MQGSGTQIGETYEGRNVKFSGDVTVNIPCISTKCKLCLTQSSLGLYGNVLKTAVWHVCALAKRNVTKAVFDPHAFNLAHHLAISLPQSSLNLILVAFVVTPGQLPKFCAASHNAPGHLHA